MKTKLELVRKLMDDATDDLRYALDMWYFFDIPVEETLRRRNNDFQIRL